MKEIWKPISGYDGMYEVSSFGRVRSLKTGVPKILRQSIKRDGYPAVSLCRFGTKQVRVHILVLNAFIGPRPFGMEACHYPDRSPLNNRADNLSWGTPKENQNHREEHGTKLVGQSHQNSKLTDADAEEIFRLRGEGFLQRDIAARFGVTQPCISMILSKQRWKHFEAAL